MHPGLAVAHVGLAEALLFTDYPEPVEVARIRGPREAALRLECDAFEVLVDRGWRGPWARPWLDRDSDFDALRGSRRFEKLTAMVGPAA